MTRLTNEGYYLQAFNGLETQNKDTWNWAAFFFTGNWMLYRKMYLYFYCFSILNLLVDGGLYFIDTLLHLDPNSFWGQTFPFITKPVSMLYLIATLLYALAASFVFGKYANRLYYHLVKKRIQQGYHLLENYHPTSYSILIFALLNPILLLITPIVYGIADYINRRSLILPTSEESLEINESHIQTYLTRSKKDAFANKVAKFILAILCLLLLVSIIYYAKLLVSSTHNEVQNNLQNIAETLDSNTIANNKMP